MQITGVGIESRFLSEARLRVYSDYARECSVLRDERSIAVLAMLLYRWNVWASSTAFEYISFVEVCVRNALDHCLQVWVRKQPYQAPTDWIVVGPVNPIDRIRALINNDDKDYLAEAYRNALHQQRGWRSDQSHPRHGQTINRDDVFAQLTLGTWDGMLKRANKDPELAHVLMGAFSNIEEAWESEQRRMPKMRLPGNENDSHEDRLRKEVIDRLTSVRRVRNRIAHDENLLRVQFPKLRYDMFFVLNALDKACPNWAFPDQAAPLKTMNPLNVVKDFTLRALNEKE
mgnify:CR=1 FL=1